MKKKIATLLLFLFSCLSVLTGCNLFTTNNTAGLNSVVATAGNITITREQLINAYNNSGYYYNQYYGYSMEEALKKTIKDLINRQYILDYIDEQSESNSELQLSDKEKCQVITETWEYIDSSIKSIATQIEKEMGLYEEEEEEETTDEDSSDFSGYTPYTTKFEKDENGKIYKIEDEEEDGSYTIFEINENTKYEYNEHNALTSLNGYNADMKKIIMNRYISSLKKSESFYGEQKDNSDDAVLKRQIDKIYKSNLENAKIERFEDTIEDRFGLEYDSEKQRYYVNEDTLNKMIEKYTKITDSNKEVFNNAKAVNSNYFYNSLVNSNKRENYLYYGDGSEELLTCIHILVKFTDEQTENIEAYDSEEYADDEEIAECLKTQKSQENTLATERDFNTGKAKENGTTLSVKQLFNNLLEKVNKISYGYNTEMYLNEITNIFNEYIYTYGQDEGIMNAKFDYIVGTETSQMVDSFTEVVRKLYNNGEVNKTNNYSVTAEYDEDVTLVFPKGVGYAGAFSEPFLQESSNYSGYHIVLFTGTLKNVDASTLNTTNLFEKLSTKTSISYKETIFEHIYDLVASDGFYDTIQNNVLATSPTPNYVTSNFSDLF